MSRRTIPLPFAVDLHRSLRPLRLGKHDPTILLAPTAVELSMRTPVGPASLRAQLVSRQFEVEAWGDGAEWALARFHGDADALRLPRTGRVVAALLPAVLGQRVAGFEPKRSHRQMVERWGDPAPGPTRVMLPPAPAVIAELGYYELHVIG